MKQTIEIEVPEGFEAKYNPEENKIELIKKYSKPKTWEEYCNNNTAKGKYYIGGNSSIGYYKDDDIIGIDVDRNLIASKKEAEAFLALMQLRILRRAWVGDWIPDYTDNKTAKWSIRASKNEFDIESYYLYSHPFSFPDREMAKEFMCHFKNLLEIAKPLL